MQICNFFVVSENGQALLSMPDIKLLNTVTISCYTIGTDREDKNTNCSTVIVPVMQEVSSTVQTQGWKGALHEQTAMCITIQTQEAIQILNNGNTFTPTVKNYDIKYFLQGPSKESDRRASTKITKQLKGILKMFLMVYGVL